MHHKTESAPIFGRIKKSHNFPLKTKVTWTVELDKELRPLQPFLLPPPPKSPV